MIYRKGWGIPETGVAVWVKAKPIGAIASPVNWYDSSKINGISVGCTAAEFHIPPQC